MNAPLKSLQRQLRPARPFGIAPAMLLLPATAAAGWIGYSTFFIPKRLQLPHAVSGERREIDSAAGRLSYYTAAPESFAPGGEPPLLLIHSVNAAASAYEIRPLYEHYRTSRRVYALDLPGFGFSERSDREYTPRLMADAVKVMVEEIRRREGSQPIDALALSLGSEFLARAAAEKPEAFRSLALVSPTGFDSRGPRQGEPDSTRGNWLLYDALSFPVWGRAVFDLLNTRISARFFLEKAWGSKDIDNDLWEYCYLTSHQPGAEHAPFYFVGGFLFSNDITDVYQSLRMPVYMVHGVRGDFVDYSGARAFQAKPNWTIEAFQTGAFPQFERLDEVTRAYDSFLQRVSSGVAPAAAG
jgi:pimeloyl-ACP methyl ester carboxylesterase